jgi:hypothetical protein
MWMRLCLVVVLLLGASRAGAQSADNVLVVINEKSADSIKVGEYYANARTIAADHVVRIQTSTEESISLDQYLRPAMRLGRLPDLIWIMVVRAGPG